MYNRFLQWNLQVNSWSTQLINKLTPQNKLLKNLVYLLLLLCAVHFFYAFIGVYDYLDYRPTSIHSWAQSQRASIAQCYYKESMDFFKPRVQRFTPDGGITGM